MQMRVFTLDTSNIKGIARKFARSRPVWIGPYHCTTVKTRMLVSGRVCSRMFAKWHSDIFLRGGNSTNEQTNEQINESTEEQTDITSYFEYPPCAVSGHNWQIVSG